MPAERTVLLRTSDLLFRAKLAAVAERAGARTVRGGPAMVAVVELGGPDALPLVRRLVADGAQVLAFGAHVRPDLLGAARELGAEAVPNSRIETRLLAALTDD